MEQWALRIDRADIAQAAIDRFTAPPLDTGEVEFAIELVALTANNVTYAVLGGPTPILGEDVGYWDFFAERDAPARLPVWGFARVTRSAREGVAAGERFYGYWPLASHAVVRPDTLTATGFFVGGARARLPALYNSYQRTAALDGFVEAEMALWPVWRPLHITGWLAADQLADEGDHGPEVVVVTAASSKTAIAFAHAMRGRDDAPRVVALTSPGNRDFVGRTGLYDDVLTYDAIERLGGARIAMVDFANNGPLNARLRNVLGDRLVLDLVIGFTHWDADAAGAIEGVARTPFFAPARLAKRGREWGGAVLRDRIAAAWTRFLAEAGALVAFDERHGAEAALAAWQEVVGGHADPARAILLRP